MSADESVFDNPLVRSVIDRRDNEILRLGDEVERSRSALSEKDEEQTIDGLKASFKTVHERLQNAEATIQKRDELINEMADALSKRLEPDKIRTLLDRALGLSPSDPKRRAAEADVQRAAEHITRQEMER